MSSTVSYRANIHRPYSVQPQQKHFTERVENYYRTSENVYKMPMNGSTSPHWTGLHLNSPFGFGKSDVYELYVEVPGYKPEDISVSTKEDLLIVNGHHEENDPQHGYHSREFTNKYTLPKNVDKEKMTCMFKDRGGHLIIEAPIIKPEEPNTRTIPIKILSRSSSSSMDNNQQGMQPAQVQNGGIKQATTAQATIKPTNTNSSMVSNGASGGGGGSNVSHV